MSSPLAGQSGSSLPGSSAPAYQPSVHSFPKCFPAYCPVKSQPKNQPKNHCDPRNQSNTATTWRVVPSLDRSCRDMLHPIVAERARRAYTTILLSKVIKSRNLLAVRAGRGYSRVKEGRLHRMNPCTYPLCGRMSSPRLRRTSRLVLGRALASGVWEAEIFASKMLCGRNHDGDEWRVF